MPEINKAAMFSIHNKQQLNESNLAGCYFCMHIFPPESIKYWVDMQKDTALCPECNIDSVIGSASGYEINTETLQKIKNYWF